MSASPDYPNQDNTYGPPPVPRPPSNKSRRGAIIVVVAAVVALLIGVGIGGASKTTDTITAASGAASTTVTEQGAAGNAATVTETVQVTVTEGPPSAEFIEGTNIVGTDVQPGTYQSKNPDCYFERLSDTSGEMDDIIANGNGATVVTIDPSDKGFKSIRCAPWKKVG